MRNMITKMFTKSEKEFDDLKEIKLQTSTKELNENLKYAYGIADKYIKENEFVLKYGANVITKFLPIKLEESNLSMNRRKKIAKQIFYFVVNPTRKKLNTLLHIVGKTNSLDQKYHVYKSDKETAIDTKRISYKKLLRETEQARLTYTEEKGDYYKNKL